MAVSGAGDTAVEDNAEEVSFVTFTEVAVVDTAAKVVVGTVLTDASGFDGRYLCPNKAMTRPARKQAVNAPE